MLNLVTPYSTVTVYEHIDTYRISPDAVIEVRWETDYDGSQGIIAEYGEYTSRRTSWAIDRRAGVLLGDFEYINKHLPESKIDTFEREWESKGYNITTTRSEMRGWWHCEASGYKIVRDGLPRDTDRNQYEYFEFGNTQGYNPPQNDEEIDCLISDYETAERFSNNELWSMYVIAVLVVDDAETEESSGLGGIECEMLDSNRRQFEQEQLNQLMSQIKEITN